MFKEDKSVEIIEKKWSKLPSMAVMLGTGWNAVLEGAEVESEMGYKDLFGVDASVPGHEGKLVVAKVKGKRAVFMQGRLHMYEGYSAREATLPIRVFETTGVKRLVVTSASGGLNKNYQVGDLVVLNDLLTVFLSFDNPLKGPQFLDMSEVFDDKMRKESIRLLKSAGVAVREGVYAYLHGPNFETFADKRAMQTLGADVVGMSTVPETMMAKWLKMKVLGLSCVTNLAFVKHDHEEVLAAARNAQEKMRALLAGLVEKFGD